MKGAGFWEGFAIATGSSEKLNRISIVMPTLLATDWGRVLVRGIQRRAQRTTRSETDGVLLQCFMAAFGSLRAVWRFGEPDIGVAVFPTISAAANDSTVVTR